MLASSFITLTTIQTCGYEWASSTRGIFAQKRNLLSPKFHKFWRTILKFNDVAREELEAGNIKDATLGAFLDRHGFDQTFRDNYILPMGAAIWSTPEDRLLDYPALSFFKFFDNHRLMHKERPKWRTVTGGSQRYVAKMQDLLGDSVQSGDGAAHIARFGDKVKVTRESGKTEVYDDVILATHSDRSLDMLDASFETQRFALASARYRPNQVYLHRDPALMPKKKAAWASWNVLKQEGDDICLTYWMNKLQGIDERMPLFVTLNPNTPPRADLTFDTFQFDHPQFDAAMEAAVREVKRHQGEGGLWLAGAWMGSGFHEDGLKSGLSAALSLGGAVPWDAKGVDIFAPQRDTLPMDQQAQIAK